MVFLGCCLFFHGQLWFLIFTARVVLGFFVWLFWVVFFFCSYFGLFFGVTTIFIFFDLYYRFVVTAGVRGLVLVAGGSWPAVRGLRFVAIDWM